MAGRDGVDVFSIPSTLNCSGTVSAIDHCYNGRVDRIIHGLEYMVFTLLTLEQNNLTFEITQVIPVYSIPTAAICSDQSATRYCCDSLQLNTTIQFGLPAPNFAFGIIRSSSREVDQLRYRNRDIAGFLPEFLVEQYNFPRLLLPVLSMPAVGDTFTVPPSSRTIDRGLRVLQFVISKQSILVCHS